MPLAFLTLPLHADIKKSVPRHDDKGRISFRVTTLISEKLLSSDTLQRTIIRVSCNGEPPSALISHSALHLRDDFHSSDSTDLHHPSALYENL